MAGSFVISLDFELLWGVRDHANKDTYGRNVLGVRDAIPKMLALFSTRNIRVTWATVGMVFCETKEELMASLPEERPRYVNPRLSNYEYLPEVGKDERLDPYYFGGSLVRAIMDHPGQEVGSHSFSHYYCLEAGQTPAQFSADLKAAVAIADTRGVSLRSFVFPRNQYSAAHLAVLEQNGIRVIRGNEQSWLYRATTNQSRVRRGGRLLDSYFNLSGHHADGVENGKPANVPASRFLRPYSRRLAALEPLRMRRIASSMEHAARTDGVFHLWWHPHNFGVNTDQNIMMLNTILDHFTHLRDTYGMQSRNMGDFE